MDAVIPDRMCSALSDVFGRVPDGDKVDALMVLVKQCTFQQQLDFADKLQLHLHRDFIVDLPKNLSQKIITYLSIEEACNCLLVCKKWNEIVSDNTLYWEAIAGEIGLSDSFIRDTESKNESLKDLCIAARNHQKYICSLVVRAIPVARSPTEAQCSFHYAGKGVILRYEEKNSHAQITIEKMSSFHSTVQIASYTTIPFSSRVKWVSASDTNILWKQIDGKWNSCSTLDQSDGVVRQWDDEPVSQAFHSISFCHTCHLVTIISEAEDDCEVWDLQVVKLKPGRTTARKTVYPIPIEHIQKSRMKIRHFLGGEITLLPEKERSRKKGFCEAHCVLLQVDNSVAVHRLESVPQLQQSLISHQLLPDVRLSKPLHIFYPSRTAGHIDPLADGGSKGPSKFILSVDYKHIGLLHESYLYVWNMDNCQEESCVDLIELNLPKDSCCVALGSLYAILASNSWGIFSVINVKSGDIFTSGSLADVSFNPNAQYSDRFNFYSPLNETWLNSLAYFDFWPLVIVLDKSAYLESPKELQAVVGVRSRQNHQNHSFPKSP